MKKKTIATLVMRNGEKITVTEDGGKYWVCGKRQFRKSNSEIEKVITKKKGDE